MTDINDSVSESVRGETDVSLEAAAEGWQDDVLVEDFNYSSMTHEWEIILKLNLEVL